MKEFSNEIQKQIAESDPDRLNVYIDILDRLLLYNLAVNVMSPDMINNLLEQWERSVKSTIDTESRHRTQFLESTPQGRLAKKQKQPDGEDLRLLFLNTLDTAKHIVTRNLQKDEEDDNGIFDS